MPSMIEEVEAFNRRAQERLAAAGQQLAGQATEYLLNLSLTVWP